MATARVSMSQAQIHRAMLFDPRVSQQLIARGNAAAEYWRTLPPAEPTGRPTHGKELTGAYAASIRVKPMRTASRLKVRVYTVDPKAEWIEYGNAHMPKYAPMAATRTYMISKGAHT